MEAAIEVLTPFQTLTENAVAIRAEGEVQVIGLTDEFKENITTALAWMDNPLETDEDFERAKQDIKDSAEIEKRLKTALDDMLSGQESVAKTSAYIKGSIKSFADKRKDLNTASTKRAKEKRKEITDKGKQEIAKTIALTSVSRIFTSDPALIDNAIKRRNSYTIMEEEVAKVILSEIARLAWFERQYNANVQLLADSTSRVPTLKYHDRSALLVEDSKTLELIISSRENEHLLALKEEADRKAKADVVEKVSEEVTEPPKPINIQAPPPPKPPTISPSPFAEATFTEDPPIEEKIYTLKVQVLTTDINESIAALRSIDFIEDVVLSWVE